MNLQFCYPPFFTLAQLEGIELAARRILAEIGIAVNNEWLLKQADLSGYTVTPNRRVLVDPATVVRFLEAVRRESGNRFTVEPIPANPATNRLTASPIRYTLHEHNIATDTVQPLTTPRLIELTKLCDTLRARGLHGGGIGSPQDVPAPLRPIMQYWICATYSRNLTAPTLIDSVAGMPFELAMAEAMGSPIRTASVFCLSPLQLAGHSIEYTILGRNHFDSIVVSSMPSAGSTAPLLPADALAMAAAEVIGPAILLRDILKLPTAFALPLYPVDMRSLFQVMGSPEDLLLSVACHQVDAFLHGRPWSASSSGRILTNAKLPGVQAAAEKSAAFHLGAITGTRHFGGAGVLSLDEVFSAEQLIHDLEMKDQAERLIRGLPTDCDAERAVTEVRNGLEAASFAGLDTTVDAYRQCYWMPAIFRRDTIGHWRNTGEKREKDAVRNHIDKLLQHYDYEVAPDKKRELDRILKAAKRHLL